MIAALPCFKYSVEMTKVVHLVIFLASLVSFGCSPMRYSQYTGKNTGWPTSSGALAETSYSIPVYRNAPERPYEVIGSVRFVDPRKYWDDGIIRMASSTGKKRGGDAIYIPAFGTPGSWLDSYISRPVGYDQETRAFVIKWIPEHVIQSRRIEEERFWNDFKEKNPRLSGKDQLVQLATRHLRDLGVTAYGAEMEGKLVRILTEIQGQEAKDISGKWLFKGTVQIKSLTAADAPEPFFGLATLALNGNRITILSTEGKVEVNFSGTVETGQAVGTLGLGGQASSLSVKCEGVAQNDKISFAFQKLVESGTVQGNLTLMR